MPLSQSDPSLDYDGSWGDASAKWPCLRFENEQVAQDAYVHAHRDAKISYGRYVLVGRDLRLESLDLLQRFRAWLKRNTGIRRVETEGGRQT